jgi:hypothetical protein
MATSIRSYLGPEVAILGMVVYYVAGIKTINLRDLDSLAILMINIGY